MPPELPTGDHIGRSVSWTPFSKILYPLPELLQRFLKCRLKHALYMSQLGQDQIKHNNWASFHCEQ